MPLEQGTSSLMAPVSQLPAAADRDSSVQLSFMHVWQNIAEQDCAYSSVDLGLRKVRKTYKHADMFCSAF